MRIYGSTIKKYEVLQDENPLHKKVFIYNRKNGYRIISPFQEYVLKDLTIAQEKYVKRMEEKRILEQLTVQSGVIVPQRVLTKRKRELASRMNK